MKTSLSSLYKIRRADGKFSTGGTTPTFSKHGKVWNTLGHLKCHLTGVADAGRYGETDAAKKARIMGFYHDCEVVTYEQVVTAVSTVSIKNLMGY